MLRAEFQKMKRTALFWMHVFVPVIGAGIVLWYYEGLGMLHMNARSIGEFMEILSLVFPALSGIVCALAVEMETEAGNMQVLLGGVSGKCRAAAVKLLALLLLAGLGTVLALGCYIAGVWLETGEKFSVAYDLCDPSFSEPEMAERDHNRSRDRGEYAGSFVSHNDGRWDLDVLSVCMGDAASEIYDIL